MAPLAVGFDCPLGQGLGVPGTSMWEAVAEDPVGMGRETLEHRPPSLCLREVHLWNGLFFFFILVGRRSGVPGRVAQIPATSPSPLPRLR